MKRLMYPLLAGMLLLASAFTAITSQDWSIDKDFSIKFTSKDPSGIFESFKGTISFDEADLSTAKFDLTIDVNSINMGNNMKNKKSLTSEWFDEAKYKTIKFVSTKFEKTADGYKVTGNMKIKGITKVYTIPMKFAGSGNTGKFTGTFYLNRIEFGVGEKSDVVPDKLKIDFVVPVTKK